MAAPDFKYDVAFSFLAVDVALAENLAEQLSPGLSTFVYSRRKEEVLGRDGMDQFATVFGKEARLTVILYRDGWGDTPWTHFEETHIKDRALVSHMDSFVVVRLDKADPPLWVPSTHLYLNTDSDTTSDIVAVIRFRAKQQGATIHRATVAESVAAASRKGRAQQARRQREDSLQGIEEVGEEVQRLFAEIGRLAAEVKAADSTIELQFGANRDECAIASRNFSTALFWRLQYGNTLRGARLRVGDFKARARVPEGGRGTSGSAWQGAFHYVPRLSDSDIWVWRRAPELDEVGRNSGLAFYKVASDGEDYSTPDLADYLVRRFFRYSLESESE